MSELTWIKVLRAINAGLFVTTNPDLNIDPLSPCLTVGRYIADPASEESSHQINWEDVTQWVNQWDHSE